MFDVVRASCSIHTFSGQVHFIQYFVSKHVGNAVQLSFTEQHLNKGKYTIVLFVKYIAYKDYVPIRGKYILCELYLQKTCNPKPLNKSKYFIRINNFASRDLSLF